MKALVDGDVLVYRCGFAAQHKYYRVYLSGEEDMGHVAQFEYKKDVDIYTKDSPEGKFIIKPYVHVEPVENALHNFKQVVEKIEAATGAKELSFYLTGDGNYREKIAVIRPYKGNRDPAHKPEHYLALREYALNRWGAILVEGQEADDAMGIAQPFDYADEFSPRTIICTNDKDLNMIPGWHYNFVKDEKTWITEQQALRFFYQQLLSGDPTDNIVGIPGIGPKTAIKLLAETPSNDVDMYKVCLAQYENSYGAMAEDILLENARLLWIRRREGEIWSPTNAA